MGIVVECVGGTGVGKSRAADALVAELRSGGVDSWLAMAPIGPLIPKPRRVVRKASLALVEAARSPGACLDMVRAVATSGQQRAHDGFALTLSWLAIRALVRRGRRASSFHVFDQAALMNLWSTGLRGDASACRAVLEQPRWSWVLPDAVLRVETSRELNLAQLRGRSERQSRLEGLDDAGLSVALERAAADVASLVGWWGDARADDGPHLAVTLLNHGDQRLTQAMPAVASQLLSLGASRATESQVAP